MNAIIKNLKEEEKAQIKAVHQILQINRLKETNSENESLENILKVKVEGLSDIHSEYRLNAVKHSIKVIQGLLSTFGNLSLQSAFKMACDNYKEVVGEEAYHKKLKYII